MQINVINSIRDCRNMPFRMPGQYSGFRLVHNNKDTSSIHPMPVSKGKPKLTLVKKLLSLKKEESSQREDYKLDHQNDRPDVPADDMVPDRGQKSIDTDTTAPFAPGAGGEVGPGDACGGG
ncbi:hypothetical protein [Candidatus Odyssella thessalonicensis]|uniref:hypothetical protein n=1 Tax=Candidatus Odyssella thessalonicensis TaxID=84647 RepID=UPI000225BEBB|nr:hypothetical protein [Candidatus Odyssella thessalonicensis]